MFAGLRDANVQDLLPPPPPRRSPGVLHIPAMAMHLFVFFYALTDKSKYPRTVSLRQDGYRGGCIQAFPLTQLWLKRFGSQMTTTVQTLLTTTQLLGEEESHGTQIPPAACCLQLYSLPSNFYRHAIFTSTPQAATTQLNCTWTYSGPWGHESTIRELHYFQSPSRSISMLPTPRSSNTNTTHSPILQHQQSTYYPCQCRASTCTGFRTGSRPYGNHGKSS